MLGQLIDVLRLGLFLLVVSLPLLAVAQENKPAPADPVPAVPAEQLQDLVKDLNDPAARERLIRQLNTLVQVKAAQAKPANDVHDATAATLQAASAKVHDLTEVAAQLGGIMDALPRALAWFRSQLANPESQQRWLEIAQNLALVLGAGYAGFFLLRLLTVKPRRLLDRYAARGPLARVLFLLLLFLLDALAIAAFGVAAYVSLGLVDPPREQTRLVALAWIDAAIITRTILAASRMLSAPTASGLRLLPWSDETAHYLNIWVRRLTFIPIYGYFALQTALLLGLPKAAYTALLRALGLLITALVLIFIFQNRAAVAGYLRGEKPTATQTFSFWVLRRRFAQVWHLLAALYVLVLYSIWALDIEGGFLFLLRASALTLLILVVGQYALNLLCWVFARGFCIGPELKAQFPGLETRVNRYIPLLHAAGRGLIYLVMTLAILQAWGIDTFAWLLSEPGRVLSRTAATIVGIVAAAFISWELVSSLIERYLTKIDRRGQIRLRNSRARTLLTVARNALFIVLLVLSTLLILSELGINITPLLAGAGVVGVAVGFGSQKLVQDIINGVLILSEDLIAVGDVVDVGGKSGRVEAVSIRHVRLRDLSGTVHTIPYSTIGIISNLTKDFSYYVFDVKVAYHQDVDQVMEILKQLGAELQRDSKFQSLILEPLEILGVEEFTNAAVLIKARIRTLPIKQWTIGREFNRRLKQRFEELGIEMAAA
ncbi:MAG: mechanosensitive ion channel [Candidatus Competibacteraceae bacterium]